VITEKNSVFTIGGCRFFSGDAIIGKFWCGRLFNGRF